MVQQARLPYKMAFGLFAGFRFLPLLGTEFENIRAAHRVRGAGGGRGWHATLTEVRRSLIPLFALVIRKANQIGVAMESKGFGAHPDRTYLTEVKITWRDIVFLCGVILVLAAAIYGFVKLGYISQLGPRLGTPYQQIR